MHKSIIAIIVVCAAILAGCRSPEVYREQADQVASSTIDEFQKKALGETKPFSIERPSDRLRRKLMIEQNLPSYTNTTDAVFRESDKIVLDKIDCLQVAARNSNSYQENKENVFRAALALDLQRDNYRNTWTGIITALFSSDMSGDETESQVSGGFTTGLSRTFKSGASIATKLGIDVVKLLTLDESSSYGILADATITVPLMRDAGRAIVTEPLTQAERNLMYALWSFERYRRTFAVGIASEYFSVLQTEDELRNAKDNVERLKRSLARSEELAKAGRLPEVEVDQTRQDLLRAQSRLLTTRQNAEQQMDSFKQTLGLPVDAVVELDNSGLESLSKSSAKALGAASGESVPSEAPLIRQAIEKRRDLRIAFERVADATRQLLVARDALQAGLEFQASGNTQERRYSGTDTADIHIDQGNYNAGFNLSLPWERTAERNAYRLQMIDVDEALRNLEDQEDQVKKDVRDSIRNLVESRENYIIQQEALKLARSRVESTQMFMDAGRASTRDMLEAEEALVSAKNAVTAALVTYRISKLQLLNDTGTLDITEEWGIDI